MTGVRRSAVLWAAAWGVCAASVAAEPALHAVVETSRGAMRIELHPDEAPLGVASVCFLADQGFYDGMPIQAATAEFVLTGDPTGTGSGSAGYRLRHEFNLKRKHDRPGVVGLGNQGPGTNGSQLVLDRKAVSRFDGRVTIVGQVVAGLDVLANLTTGDRIERLRVEGHPGQLLARFPEEIAAWRAARALRASSPEELHAMAVRSLADRGLKVELGRFTDSGLWVLDLVEGQGRPVLGVRQLTLRLEGWLPDGTVFQPADRPLERIDPRYMIPGVQEALLPMRVGSRRVVIVPGPLGYGEKGNPAADIPPHMPLVFDIEVVEAFR